MAALILSNIIVERLRCGPEYLHAIDDVECFFHHAPFYPDFVA